MTSHLKNRKSRTLFDDITFQSQQSTSSTHKLTHKRNKSIHSSSQFMQDTPIITPQSDSITLTATNYNPTQTLINLTGFDNLTPFLKQSQTINDSLSSSHDNSYSDYNENGTNDINGGNYRQLLIQQMKQKLLKQTNEMFRNSELTSLNQKPNEHMFDVSSNYQPSTAPGNYVKQQAKGIFKNINE